MNTTSKQQAFDDKEQASFQSLFDAYRLWIRSVLGLGALEAKLWVVSGAQLLALTCGFIFLLITAWLLLLSFLGVIAWHAGIPVLGILLIEISLTLLSAYFLFQAMKRRAKNLDFTATLNAIIEDSEE